MISNYLTGAVQWPHAHRLLTLPRSISWEEVGRVLALPDRRTPAGRRDYAIMLLLATYGLRAREIVALTLDDIDWKRARLAIPERKAAHSTVFPLSGAVGEALAGDLRNGRRKLMTGMSSSACRRPSARSAARSCRASPAAT